MRSVAGHRLTAGGVPSEQHHSSFAHKKVTPLTTTREGPTRGSYRQGGTFRSDYQNGHTQIFVPPTAARPTLQRMVEQVPYKVVAEYPGFELREYPEYLLVTVEAPGDIESASYRGFGPLFRYISGDNQQAEKIAMTAPVFQEQSAPDRHRVSFALPRSYSLDTIPRPADSRLQVTAVPPHTAAVMRFRGSWSEAAITAKAEDLRRAVAAAGLHAEGEVTSARYDPPYKPPILRRNEVLLRVTAPGRHTS